MVKLLRLTSNRDDDYANAEDGLVFSVNMDDELIVTENSQIALKNLTFENDFRALDISQQNGLLSIKYQTGVGASIMYLTSAEYTKSTYSNFFTNLNITLNRCLNPRKIDDEANDPVQGFYAQYYVDPLAQFKDIQFRLTPALNPVIDRSLLSADPDDWGIVTNLMRQAPNGSDATIDIDYNKVITPADLLPSDMCIVKGAHNVAISTRKKYLASANSAVQWSKGTAVWSIRINELHANGGAADTNGFELGLASNIPFGRNDTAIADDDVKFAIRCTTPTADFQHIVPTADFTSNPVYVTNTGIAPTAPVPTQSKLSDTLVISCSQRMNLQTDKKITGQVFREGVVVQELFSYSVPPGKEDSVLFPYVCFFDVAANPVSAHSPVATFDPFVIAPNTDETEYIKELQPFYGNAFCGLGVFSETVVAYDATARVGIPDLEEDWYGSKGISQDSFMLMYNDVWDFLGFTQAQLDGPTPSSKTSAFPFLINTTAVPYGFDLAPDGVSTVSQSDNFVVVLDSQKLISYDCSKPITNTQSRAVDVVGRRANILATIPVNNNSGIVEFQSNEVLFIDMDNKAPTAIRNLRLRVLDKTLQPITVEGMSVMTLLIKD